MERLVPPRETLTVEFKSDQKPVSDDTVIDSVVAFANTEGGELYLGVEDDGRITGIHHTHSDITKLAAFILLNIHYGVSLFAYPFLLYH